MAWEEIRELKEKLAAVNQGHGKDAWKIWRQVLLPSVLQPTAVAQAIRIRCCLRHIKLGPTSKGRRGEVEINGSLAGGFTAGGQG